MGQFHLPDETYCILACLDSDPDLTRDGVLFLTKDRYNRQAIGRRDKL